MCVICVSECVCVMCVCECVCVICVCECVCVRFCSDLLLVIARRAECNLTACATIAPITITHTDSSTSVHKTCMYTHLHTYCKRNQTFTDKHTTCPLCRHAFAADSLLSLVFQIVKGTFPPIPTSDYSTQLSGLVNSLLNREVAQRPSLAQVLLSCNVQASNLIRPIRLIRLMALHYRLTTHGISATLQCAAHSLAIKPI
jgi:hypothetical protein